MESNLIICSSVGVFKIGLIVTHIFVAYSLLEFQIKLVNLVIDISKLSRQISLSRCTFGQKDFTQVAQVHISSDAVTRPVLTLAY